MKQETKYAKKTYRKIKFNLFIIAWVCFMVAILLGVLLNYHLFRIQQVARLDKFKDYNEFRLELTKKDICTDDDNVLVYEDDESRLYFHCLKHVTVYYGTTPTTIANAFGHDYLSIEYLKENTVLEEKDGYVVNKFLGSNNDRAKYLLYTVYHEEDKTDYYLAGA